MREAIAKSRVELGREYPLVIGGERIKTGDFLESINPANRTRSSDGLTKRQKSSRSRR